MPEQIVGNGTDEDPIRTNDKVRVKCPWADKDSKITKLCWYSHDCPFTDACEKGEYGVIEAELVANIREAG